VSKDHFRAILDLLAFLSFQCGKKRFDFGLRPDFEHFPLFTATIKEKDTEGSHPAGNHGHRNWTWA
jgi:hypothetical protein